MSTDILILAAAMAVLKAAQKAERQAFARWWACERKITYYTRRRAKRSVRLLNQKYKTNKKVYRCRFCDYFHVGALKNGRPAAHIGEEAIAKTRI